MSPTTVDAREPFFTIGHSNRSLDEFVALLQASRIRLVADVRKIPKSRKNPQFAQDQLAAGLADFQIGYAYLPALGGRRGKQNADADSPNRFWRVVSFRNYADYALTPSFADGFSELRKLGRMQRTAVMCAEAVWWRCHRRLIADHLLLAGEQVFHILGPGNVDVAEINPAATLRDDGAVIYPAL